MIDVTDRFAEAVTRPEAEVALDQAALLIAAHARPDLDLATELGRLDDLAAGVGEPTLDGLVRHLFRDLGFAGNVRDYYDPRNSYLDQVVERRLGIPITLSVLAITVGRRLGVPLSGVSMPGHFLLRDRVDPTVFVDPYHRGARLDADGCARVFHGIQGDAVAFDPTFLEPVGARTILVRMLANLRSVFLAAGEREAVVWAVRLRTLVPGAGPDDRADLATALAATGDYVGAARELDGVAATVGGPLGEQHARAASALRARLN